MRLDFPLARLLAGPLLLLLGLIVYASSLTAPFQFDDLEAIEGNPTIRRLSVDTLRPPVDGTGVAGRPIVNLSLALNHALGGHDPAGYHLFNVTLHALSSLVLFGLVRRTLQQPPLHVGAERALLAAWMAAAVWLVHPEQTESVTGVIQRTELLVGFFYLLTLYAFVRGVGPNASRAWLGAAIAACLLGMASKEVMVTAPLLVLLYDRTFVAGNFRAAWQARRSFYLGLAATWLLLGWLVLRGGGSRGNAAGFGLGVTPLEYALKQCDAIWIYLKLAFWPYPLVVDYGSDLTVHPAWIWVQALLLATLVGGTVHALVRRPVAGFLGAWFFAILAPSSSVVPLLTQTVAEHRMYLPLAALVVPAVAWAPRRIASGRGSVLAGLCVLTAFGSLTRLRNADYRSGVALWQDTVAKRPRNPRAWHNLGVELARDAARAEQAAASFRAALRLDSQSAEAHYGLALLLARTPGGTEEAIAHYTAAVLAAPTHVEAQLNLADLLAGQPERLPDALALYAHVLARDDANPRAHNNLAAALAQLPDRTDEAIAHHEKALRLRPGDALAHYNLANLLARSTARVPEAIAHYERALALRPELVPAHYNLANELGKLPGRLPDAITHYEAALRLQPDYLSAHFNLAIAYARTGRTTDAIRHFEIVLQLNPSAEEARRNIAVLQAQSR